MFTLFLIFFTVLNPFLDILNIFEVFVHFPFSMLGILHFNWDQVDLGPAIIIVLFDCVLEHFYYSQHKKTCVFRTVTKDSTSSLAMDIVINHEVYLQLIKGLHCTVMLVKAFFLLDLEFV